MNIAFDTNTYRAAADGNQFFVALGKKADQLALPIIVLGEIKAGVLLGSKKDRNTVLLAEFLANPRVRILDMDEDTATYYASIFVQLRTQGTPIPENDIWIAALCLQHGFTLATQDKHFSHVTGLQTLGLTAS